MNGVNVMPVRVKPEPQESNAVPAPAGSLGQQNGAPSPTQARTTLPPSSSSSSCSTASLTPSSLPHAPDQHAAATMGTGGPAEASGPNKVDQPKEKLPSPTEEAIDCDSVRGVFGWTTLDGVNVPYIIRKYRKFVAVRIVEKKMLSKYPNSFPDELGKKEPLVSYFVTEAEANLLNEINTVHCSFEYGHQPFTTKDLIVDLVEFEEFYKLVKKTFPEDVLASMTGDGEETGADEKKRHLSKLCGWMQINNTVTPYINRAPGKYVPLSVIVYAAGLLRKDNVEGLLPSPEECSLLNATCQTAGFDFSFGKNTRLIHIAEVVQRCQVRIFELPFENPLQHAQYIDSLQQTDSGGAVPPPPHPGQSNMTGGMALPYRSKPLSSGPPNINIFGGQYNPFASMLNMLSQPSTSSSSLPRDSQPMSVPFPPGPRVCQASHMSRFFSHGAQLPAVPMNPGLNTFTRPVFNHLAGMRPEVGVVSSQGDKGPPANAVSSVQSRPGVPGRQGAGPTPPGPCPPGMMHRGQHPALPPPPPYGHFPSHHMQPGRPPLPPSSSPSASLHGFPRHIGNPEAGMIYPGLGPVPRGAVHMIGFPPPAGVAPGPTSGMPPPPVPNPLPQQPQPLPTPSTRSSPRSAGLSPAAERTSPARQSPLVPVHVVGRETGGTGPLNPQAVAPVVPVHITPVGQGLPVLMNHVGPSADPGLSMRVSAAHQTVDPAAELVTGSQSKEGAPRLTNVPLAHRPSSPQNRPKATTNSDGHLKLVADITAVLVHNKSISCLVRDSPERKGRFCLVEAVSKLYFPHCKLSEFVHALQNVLKINLPLCTAEEAKAFIHFYNLPVSTLNDNHMIQLQDLQKYFPQMAYMFGPCDGPKAAKPPPPVTARRSSGSETTRLTSPSAPITVVLTSTETDEVISIDSGPPTPVQGSPGLAQGAGMKRPAQTGAPAAAATEAAAAGGKQPCHRLEQMVQRLKQTQEPAVGDPAMTDRDAGVRAAGASSELCMQPPTTSGSASVIVID